jgi:hypothetical protein
MDKKLIAAVVDYYLSQQEVKRLSQAIGSALADCYETQCPPGSDTKIVEHLKDAYTLDCDNEDYGRRYLTNGDPALYLAETCPHCLAAHNLIQDRKAARKRFGIAKRRVSMLGRSLSKGQAL